MTAMIANRNSPSDGMEKSKITNVTMIQSAVRAVERLSENFQVMVVQTSINVSRYCLQSEK
jgi:hypothetical protein